MPQAYQLYDHPFGSEHYRRAIKRFEQGRQYRLYRYLGCHYRAKSDDCTLAVWAPSARSVSVVGDFNDWQQGSCPLQRGYGGIFYGLAQGLRPGGLYKYCVADSNGHCVLKCDPLAFAAEKPPNSASCVAQLDDYSWHDDDYLTARRSRDWQREAVNIYELHPGSWRHVHGRVPTYRELAPLLADYCRKMSYTHVELMALLHHPYDGSWGYQVGAYFAPSSLYGSPQELMFLVDSLHAEGIGVIMDWVPAHFPRDEHLLAYFDGQALFEPPGPRADHPQWGTLIFDYARPQVRSFLISSAMFWCEYYHIDGLRVDAVSSMLYRNYAREEGYEPHPLGGVIDLDAVSLLRGMNDALHRCFPGCISIAEESTAYPGVSADTACGGLGFDFKWDMGWMHDTLDYMSMDHIYRSYHHDKLTFSMMYAFCERFVNSLSHDEVVHGKRSLLDKMFGDYWQKFAALRAMYAYQYARPGKKLLFMGGEFGQFIEWDHTKELDWFLLDYPAHDALQRYVCRLNEIYLREPALWRVDDSWDGFCWLSVDERERSAIAFMRSSDRADDTPLVCVCNFTPTPGYMRIGLPQGGCLQELLNSDAPCFGGSGWAQKAVYEAEPCACNGLPYSTVVALPPLSSVYYRFCSNRLV